MPPRSSDSSGCNLFRRQLRFPNGLPKLPELANELEAICRYAQCPTIQLVGGIRTNSLRRCMVRLSLILALRDYERWLELGDPERPPVDLVRLFDVDFMKNLACEIRQGCSLARSAKVSRRNTAPSEAAPPNVGRLWLLGRHRVV
jgi:hypothetical protein